MAAFIISSNVDQMYVIDHDFYTLKKQKRDAFENNFRSAYLSYINGGKIKIIILIDWNTAQNYIT